MVKHQQDYDKAIANLLELLEPDDAQYGDVLTLKARLDRVERDIQVVGEGPQDRTEWGRIIRALNEIAAEVAGVGIDQLESRDTVLEPLPTPSSRPYPFPGLDSLGTEDKDIFFGRDREVNELLTIVQQDSVVVINGLSGSGKSSLMKAGIIPSLREMDYVVLYTPVFEDVVDDVHKQIQQFLKSRSVAERWDDDLYSLYQEMRSPVVLVVDQFEQALSPRHNPGSLEAFLGGIRRLISLRERFATVIIVVRADWLYYLEHSVKQVYPRLNVHTCIFTVDPLDESAAREAIVKPAEQWNLPYDQSVIDSIINNLRTNSKELAIGSYIQPIQLQIVLRQLFSLAEHRGDWHQALCRDNYEASGGVESILRNYLTKAVGPRSEAWHLLARFIGPDGRTGRTRRHSELVAVPAAEDVELELRYLVSQSLVEVYQPQETEDRLYRLSHDYLVEAIKDYLQENVDHLGWKLAEDWLASGTLDWKESLKRDDSNQLLLEQDRYLHIYEYRNRLQIRNDSQRLLILTALNYGHEGLGYWISRESKPEKHVEDLVQHLLSSDLEVRVSARTALKKSLPDTKQVDTPIDAQTLDLSRNQLTSAFHESEDRLKRTAAAQALWIIDDFQTASERYQVGSLVLHRWFKNHAVQISSYVMTVVTALLIVVGIVYVNNRLQGSWHSVYTLKAGQVAQVAVDPDDPDIIYALTRGGPKPREGLSLFVKRDNTWELVSRDFAKSTPVAMKILQNEGEDPSIYLALRGKGILQTDDLGSTWAFNNRGLPSRGFTSLVIDPEDRSKFYLATGDWRGVLKSEDGGQSWKLYDYRGEIYGAKITALEHTRANDGLLIAGTDNGKILTHSDDNQGWQARYGLPKGSINSMAVATSDEQVIYAGTDRGVVIKSTDGGQTWFVLGQIDHVFNVTNLAIHPNNAEELYATAYGQGSTTLWFSEEGGMNWTKLSAHGLPRSGIGDLVVHETNPNTLLAGTTEGLFISQDRGKNWDRVNLSAPLASVSAVALHSKSPKPIYVATGNSIYSNAKGNLCTWVRGKGLRAQSLRTVVVDPVDPEIVYAGVYLEDEWSVFASVNGGKEWRQTNAPLIEPSVSDTMSLAAGKTPDEQTILYAGSLGCGIFRSEDQGESWESFGRTHCSDPGNGMPTDAYFLTVDSQDPYRIYAAAGHEVHYSEDGGRVWHKSQWISPVTSEGQSVDRPDIESPIVGLVADPRESQVAYVATRSDGFWRSEDGGDTWVSLGDPWSEGMEPTVLTAVPEVSGYLLIGASNGEVWRSTDSGRSWTPIRENLAIGHITSIATNPALEGQLILGSSKDGIAVYAPGELFPSSRTERNLGCFETTSAGP